MFSSCFLSLGKHGKPWMCVKIHIRMFFYCLLSLSKHGKPPWMCVSYSFVHSVPSPGGASLKCDCRVHFCHPFRKSAVRSLAPRSPTEPNVNGSMWLERTPLLTSSSVVLKSGTRARVRPISVRHSSDRRSSTTPKSSDSQVRAKRSTPPPTLLPSPPLPPPAF